MLSKERKFIVFFGCLFSISFVSKVSFAEGNQESFFSSCLNQDLPALREALQSSTVNANLPIPSHPDGFNCLLFLTNAGNLGGMSLLLSMGADPYYTSRGESALTLAIKNQNDFDEFSGNNAYKLSWLLSQYVDYRRMPDVLSYLSLIQEQPLPLEVIQYPIHSKNMMKSRPGYFLSYMQEQILESASPDEKERIKASEPEPYRMARERFSRFYFNKDLRYVTESRFIPLGTICNTHAVSLTSSMKKVDRRTEGLTLTRDQKEPIGKSPLRISFRDYHATASSIGPIIVLSYRDNLAAVGDGNGRIVSFNRVFDKTTLVEVLFVKLVDPEQQEEFNQITDTLLDTAHFTGFEKIYCH